VREKSRIWYYILSTSEDANCFVVVMSLHSLHPLTIPTDRKVIYKLDDTDTAHSYSSFARVVTPIIFLERVSPFAASNGHLLHYLLGNPIVPYVSVPIRKSILPVCVGCRRRLTGCLGAHYIYLFLYCIESTTTTYLLTYLLTHLIPKANRLLYLLSVQPANHKT
jgi:hypothetical protein